MTRFLHGDRLWRAIRQKAKAARRRRAAIAYFTQATALGLKAGDVLIVDASDGAIASGQISAAVIGSLFKKGVELYSHDGLHAKVVVADHTLFASSANASASSLDRLLDAGIETDSPNAVAAAIGLIQTLVETSVPIDRTFVSRIKKIKVSKHFPVGKSMSEPRQRSNGNLSLGWSACMISILQPTPPS